MRTRWQDLHATLTRTAESAALRAAWNEARARESALAEWESPAALVAHLTGRDGDLGVKDRILAALVQLVQRRGPAEELALALLWLGLWPALDRIHRRWLRSYARDPDELCSAIAFHFTSLVAHADLGRIHRVAGTLARSTKREVADECRRRHRLQSTRVELHDDEPDAILESDPPDEAFQHWLQDAVGEDDATLLLAVTALGETQHEAAARLGLGAEAGRKRFQRAMARARRALGSSKCSRRLSHSGPRTRISISNRAVRSSSN